MEQDHTEKPHFMSPEERENKQFYQEWIRAAFTEGLAGLDELIALRERFTLDTSEEERLHYRDFDLEPFYAITKEIQEKIDQEVHYAAQDLQKNIFKAELFRVGIVVDGEARLVESITTQGERILPIIHGEPYGGAIDDVLFDR